MKQVILAGNAITADILNNYLTDDSRYQVQGLTVDDEYCEKGGIDGLQTVPISCLTQNHNPKDHVIIMAMGYHDLNRSRERIYIQLKEMGFHIETYIHPDAHIYTRHPLGEGCVVLPSAVIEPHVQLSDNTMVWCNVTLAHHSRIAEHCWVASGAVISGQAQIEHNSFIGVNATIVNEVVIGEYNIIGAGALITRNTKHSTVHLARSGEEFRFSSQDYVKYFGI